MNLLLDQISNLLAGTSYNYLQNSGLYEGQPSTALFSNLLAQYSGEGADASIATSPGNLFPTDSPSALNSSAPQNLIVPHLEINIDVVSPLDQPVSVETTSANYSVLPNNSVPPEKAAPNELIRSPIANLSIITIETNPSQTRSVPETNRSKELDELIKTPIQSTNANNRISENLVVPPSQTIASSNNVVGNISAETNTARESNITSNRLPLTTTEAVAKAPQAPQAPQATQATQATQEDQAQKISNPEEIRVQPDPKQHTLRNENLAPNYTSTNSLRPTSETAIERLVTDEKVNRESVNASTSQAKPVSENLSPRSSAINPNVSTTAERLSFDKQAELVKTNDVSIERSKVSIEELQATMRLADRRIKITAEYEDYYEPKLAQDRIPLKNESFTNVVKQESGPALQPILNADQTSTVRTSEFSADHKIPLNLNSGSDVNVHTRPIANDQLLVQGKTSVIQESSSDIIKANEIRNGNNIADQIAWAQRTNTQQVRIAISPEHLGAVEIKIDDAIDGLNIQFVTQNILAKETLESFIPRLKEMLEQSGLNLQNANVSQQGEGKPNFNLSDRSLQDTLRNEHDEQADLNQPTLNPSEQTSASNHLLDAFA